MAPADCHTPPGGRGTDTVLSAIRQVSSSTARKSSPFEQEKAPGTFSQTIYRGRTASAVLPLALSKALISLITRTCSMNRPERSPCSPARLPFATLRSWHGLPPQTTSTGANSAPFSRVMSPTWSISGNRIFVTSIGNGSISLAHTGVKPCRTPASGNPPIPSNRLPRVSEAFTIAASCRGQALPPAPFLFPLGSRIHWVCQGFS